MFLGTNNKILGSGIAPRDTCTWVDMVRLVRGRGGTHLVRGREIHKRGGRNGAPPGYITSKSYSRCDN